MILTLERLRFCYLIPYIDQVSDTDSWETQILLFVTLYRSGEWYWLLRDSDFVICYLYRSGERYWLLRDDQSYISCFVCKNSIRIRWSNFCFYDYINFTSEFEFFFDEIGNSIMYETGKKSTKSSIKRYMYLSFLLVPYDSNWGSIVSYWVCLAFHPSVILSVL